MKKGELHTKNGDFKRKIPKWEKLHFLRIDNKKINLNRCIAGAVINRSHDFVQIRWVVEGADPYEISIGYSVGNDLCVVPQIR